MVKHLICLSVLAICLFEGCMMYSTGISPSSVPITANDTYTEIGPTSGSAWGVVLYCIPLFESDPMDKAVKRAVKNGGGNALVEMTSDNSMYYLWLFTIYRTRVEATSVNYVKGGANIR